MKIILPSYTFGSKKTASEILVFIAGFPDNFRSGWGNVLERFEKYAIGRADIFGMCLCFPDFQNGVHRPKPWGYSFQEIIQLLDSTINYYVPDMSKKVTLIIHDWGSYIGIVYENMFPQRVKCVISLDVGILTLPRFNRTLFIILLYQLWFAIAYYISQRFSFKIGNNLFKLYFTAVPNTVKVATSMPRPFKDVSVTMAYPYYHFWNSYLFHRENVFKPIFPSCPVLFMVSFVEI